MSPDDLDRAKREAKQHADLRAAEVTEEVDVKVADLRRDVQRLTFRRLLWGVAIIAVAVVGTWRLQMATTDAEDAASGAERAVEAVELEAAARSNAVCLQGNDTRRRIRDFVEDLLAGGDTSEQTKAEVRARLAQRFPPVACPPAPKPVRKGGAP